jgi:hypothetical protein
MYIQWWIKGIGGDAFTWLHAKDMVESGSGIQSNWLRNGYGPPIGQQLQDMLTEDNLDRHRHDYDAFGPQTPFISLAAGCVERDVLLQENHAHSAKDMALIFATEDWSRAGALFYGWSLVGLNRAAPVASLAEEVRNLQEYQEWSKWQLEGEVTAKVHIPANQIERVEWWNGEHSRDFPELDCWNYHFIRPAPLANIRLWF